MFGSRPHDGPTEAPPTPANWSPLARALFRFGALYFLIYAHPYPLSLLPTPATVAAVFDYSAEWVTAAGVVDEAIRSYAAWFARAEGWAVDATATSLFGLDGLLDRPGDSGDTLYAYVRTMLTVVAAAALTLFWTWCARRGGTYARAAAWLTIALRYYVASAMLGYGMMEVLSTSSPPWLPLDRLLAPYGDSTPESVLWSAMRSSEAYAAFTGVAALIGGSLLLFRRTASLGAIVTAGLLANVVALTFGYDAPYKLDSVHLLLAALAITAPDASRLFDILLWNKPTAPRDVGYPRVVVAGPALKALILIVLVGQTVRASLATADRREDLPPNYGIWDVRTTEIDARAALPRAGDVGGWRHLVIDRGGRCSIHREDGTRMPQQLRYSDDGSITLQTSSEWEPDVSGQQMTLTGPFARRFDADWADAAASQPQQNRAPQVRWTLARAGNAPAGADAAHPWLGTWDVRAREALGDGYLPRLQPAPTRFTRLVFAIDGSLQVTLPSGRVDAFRWELTADERPTLRVTAEGQFQISRGEQSLVLTGSFRGHAVRAAFEARDLSEFQLLRRGFRWINPIRWSRF